MVPRVIVWFLFASLAGLFFALSGMGMSSTTKVTKDLVLNYSSEEIFIYLLLVGTNMLVSRLLCLGEGATVSSSEAGNAPCMLNSSLALSGVLAVNGLYSFGIERVAKSWIKGSPTAVSSSESNVGLVGIDLLFVTGSICFL